MPSSALKNLGPMENIRHAICGAIDHARCWQDKMPLARERNHERSRADGLLDALAMTLAAPDPQVGGAYDCPLNRYNRRDRALAEAYYRAWCRRENAPTEPAITAGQPIS
jgi:hypothetical protein